jgi:type II secretory pathway component PulF
MIDTENLKTQKYFGFAKKVLITVLSIISSFLFFGLSVAIPQFKTTFENFGTEVPILTYVIINLSIIYAPLAIISLIPIVGLLASKHISFNIYNLIFKVSVFLSVFTFCFFIVSFVAMYLPIFELNNAKS